MERLGGILGRRRRRRRASKQARGLLDAFRSLLGYLFGASWMMMMIMMMMMVIMIMIMMIMMVVMEMIIIVLTKLQQGPPR